MELVVGRIGRAHGIRGDVTVEVRTDAPERRFAPGAVLRTEPPELGPLVVAAGRTHSGRLLVTFEGVTDRTAAEALRGILLIAEVDPTESSGDPEEFHDSQLIGLPVVTGTGAVVGEVAEMLHLPGQDVVAVRRPAGGDVLVPFVAAIVVEVDLERGRLVVDPPAGLLDPPGSDVADQQVD